MNHNASIRVTFYPPRHGKPIDVCFELEDYTARCFQPLPRDRELYGMPIISGAFRASDRIELQKQLLDRTKLGEYLAGKLSHAIADAITKQDTINGYEQDTP